MQINITGAVRSVYGKVTQQVKSRAMRASNALRNAELQVLTGQRHGRRYKVPGTYRRQRDKVTGRMVNGRYYTASAPGEAPAVRTGTFRNSWGERPYGERQGYRTFTIKPAIYTFVTTRNGKTLAQLLEDKNRPFTEEIKRRAMPRIVRIYTESYDL